MFFYSEQEAAPPAPLTLSKSTAALSFGSTNTGTPVSQSFTISANGTGTESYSTAITGVDSTDFSVTVNPSGPIAGGAGNISITVRFNPAFGSPSPGQQKSATLTITLTGGATDTVSLTGTAVTAGGGGGVPPSGGGGVPPSGGGGVPPSGP